MKNWRKIFFILLLSLTSSPVFSQDEFLKFINDTIHSVKFVFEAKIDSVQAFPADESGNPVPYGRADWSCGAGNFECSTFTKMFVTVCHTYKGNLPKRMIIFQKAPFVQSFAHKTLSGDTVLSFIRNPPSHGSYEYTRLPSRGYPIKLLYWCYDVKQIEDKPKHFQMHKLMESPMDEWWTFEKSEGNFAREKAYAILGQKAFMTRDELVEYLKKVMTLKRRRMG